MNTGIAWPAAHAPHGGSEPCARDPTAAVVVFAAVAAITGGIGLVCLGLASLPSRGPSQDILAGAELYATACAGCHGLRLEGKAMRSEAGAQGPVVPPLGVTGHAWRHSDATLVAIVTYGSSSPAAAAANVAMPAFADRLSGAEIRSILTFVKSRWLPSFRDFQASAPDGDSGISAAALLDPSWTLPAQCLPAEAL